MKYPVWKRELQKFPHEMYNAPLEQLVEFYKEHIRRDINSGRLVPAGFWQVARLFLISAMQTYAAICILLATDRPKRLMLQAGILNRSLLETLGNLMALCQAPQSRTRILERELFKTEASTLQRYRKSFGRDEKWQDYLSMYEQGLKIAAKEIRISQTYIKYPDRIRDRWPTPGRMIYGDKKRGQPPFLRGTRLAAFREIYEYHYGAQSEQAHQRGAALGVALVVDTPDGQWNPGHGESNIVSTAILFLTCILSELEHKGGYVSHPKLRELWSYLRDLDDEAKDLWRIRYSQLLKDF